MSKEDLYFTANLSILRSGTSELEALENILSVGTVNAGLGYLKAHGQIAFERVLRVALQRAEDEGLRSTPPINFPSVEAWTYALAGWQILEHHSGSFAGAAQAWIDHHRDGEVFFRIRADWLWQAIYQARSEAGRNVPESKPLSWREFRILVAILSAKVNGYGFVFLGWESIQARASGFHTKELFKRNADKLPSHCPPLSRYQIDATLKRLETMKLFARVRHSKGTRGGWYAYSFRRSRIELQKAIKQWDADNNSFEAKTAENRAADLAHFAAKAPAPKPVPDEMHWGRPRHWDF